MAKLNLLGNRSCVFRLAILCPRNGSPSGLTNRCVLCIPAVTLQQGTRYMRSHQGLVIAHCVKITHLALAFEETLSVCKNGGTYYYVKESNA